MLNSSESFHFPYATYEMTAKINGGAGFKFILPITEAEITKSAEKLRYRCGDHTEEFDLPEASDTMIVSCRPGAFDVYFKKNGKAEFFTTFAEEKFNDSNDYAIFSEGRAALYLSGCAEVSAVSFYVDIGIPLHDYLVLRRIHLVNDLIHRGDSITDACFAAGFKNYSNFFRLYKKHTGMTPQEFKNSIEKQA